MRQPWNEATADDVVFKGEHGVAHARLRRITRAPRHSQAARPCPAEPLFGCGSTGNLTPKGLRVRALGAARRRPLTGLVSASSGG